MNTGMADVLNATWKLDLLVRGLAAPGLLATYDAEREQLVASVLANTDRLTGLSTADNPIVRAVRDFALPLLTSLTYVQQLAAANLAMLSYAYTAGPLVRGRHPLVGRQLPHALVADGAAAGDGAATLLDLCTRARGHFLVLLYAHAADGWTGAAAAVAALQQRFPGCPIAFACVAGSAAAAAAAPTRPAYVDVHGHVGALVGAAAARVYIRPDLFVGAVCAAASADDVAYLAKAFR